MQARIGLLKALTQQRANFAIDFGTFGWYKRSILGSSKSLILLSL